MGIRGKHVNDEIKKAEEVTVNATIVEKVLVKLATVGLRLILNVRLNQVKIMEKLGVKKIESYLPKQDETIGGTDGSEVNDVENK